ncbi:unnamed protein product [Ectocarpus sp. 8 AP-2014]
MPRYTWLQSKGTWRLWLFWWRPAQTPLCIATQYGHLRFVVALMEAGADLNASTTKGWPPIFFAATEGYLEILVALMNAGADLHATVPGNTTLLLLASLFGHVEIVKALINAGEDVNASSTPGVRPLHEACSKGHLEVVTVLIKAGADLSASDTRGFTPLLMAFMEQTEAGEITDVFNTPHVMVHRDRKFEIAAVLVDGGADVNAADTHGLTPLHLAAADYSNCKIVTKLIKAGADVNAANTDGLTPLHAAAFDSSHCEIVTKLIEAGADVHAEDPGGHTPLNCAVGQNCCTRLLRLLVDAGGVTTSAVSVKTVGGEMISNETPLETVNRRLKEKKLDEKNATEDHIHRLEGARRLLSCAEAVHATSWLRHDDSGPSIVECAEEGPNEKTTESTALRMTLPMLRLRSRKRVVLLRALLRLGAKEEDGAACGR